MASASAQQAQSRFSVTKITAKAPLADTLRISILGAGLGGTLLALGLANRGFTTIDLFEQAREISEVGAGINIGPNFSRVLARLGVIDATHAAAVPIISTETRRATTNEVLAQVDFAYMTEAYGSGPYVAHRADTMRAIYDACNATGRVRIHLSQRITDFDFDQTRIKLADGRWHDADVIFAADGVKSKARAAMLERTGGKDDIRETGQAAYRILLPRKLMELDPELLKLIDTPRVTRWTGHKRHVIAYPISGKSIYNISTIQPDTRFPPGDSTSWTTSGSKSELLNDFHDFCPLVQKFLGLAPDNEILEWKLRVHGPLDTWVHKRVALIGDACHPTLPHLAQGAAQAAEDGDVLAAIFGKLTSVDQIEAGLRVYELVRKARAEFIVDGAAQSGKALHLAEGDSADRDAAFKAVAAGGSNPDRWADKKMQDILFGVDCAARIEREWDSLLAQVQSPS